MGRLASKVAVVTGAARGIGRAYAVALAREGAHVTSFDRIASDDTVAEVEGAGGRCLAIRGDVTDEADVRRAMADTETHFGRIDILINNAAVLTPLSIRSSDEIDLDEFDRVMKVNVRGSFQCARAVVPYMQRVGGGKIVNISSTTAFGGPPMMHYVASKGAIVSMTYAMAAEYGAHGICVNTLAVGFTESESVAEQPAEVIDRVREVVMGRRVIKREMHAQDMARAMLFLATDESDFVTGHTLVVDGGFVMR